MNREKKKAAARALALILALAMIVTSLMMGLSMVYGASGTYVYGASSDVTDRQSLDKELEYMAGLMESIRKLYKDEVSYEVLVNGAYNGIFEALGDPHSVYYKTEEESSAFVEQSDGEFDGIGVTMKNDGYGRCLVESLVKGSPAEEAGLKSGDIIESADGVSLQGKNLNDWGTLIRGKAGTQVNLVVNRNGSRMKFTVTRATIRTESVSWEILGDNIGYIQISQFDSDCDREFLLARAAAIHAGAESLIVDVRDNPGGRVDAACNIANLLIPGEDKLIVEMTRQGESQGKILTAGAGMPNMEIVLLINENSASASEILAGALQDNKAATLVGTATYGKGIGQTMVEMDNGVGGKLSIYYFVTPNGHTIDGVGIYPDVHVINGAGLSDEQIAKEYAKLAPMTELIKYYKGQTGLNVYAAQQRLNLLGYDLALTATMDEDTVAAVKKFQGETGMYPYGGLDYSTMSMLERKVDEFLTGSGEDKQLAAAVELVTK